MIGTQSTRTDLAHTGSDSLPVIALSALGLIGAGRYVERRAEATGGAVRFAYADPPYLGTSKFGAAHHYGALHPDAADHDSVEAHEQLVGCLVGEFPDGWALSLHTPSLRTILPMCPEDVRIAAWVKGWCSWKPGVNPVYAWEPVIFRGGRKQLDGLKARDWLMANIALRQTVKGAKPVAFCEWVLHLLGYEQGDEVVDLFPGTGVMDRVVAQGRLVG